MPFLGVIHRYIDYIDSGKGTPTNHGLGLTKPPGFGPQQKVVVSQRESPKYSLDSGFG